MTRETTSPATQRTLSFVGGRSVEPLSERYTDKMDLRTGEKVCDVADSNGADLDVASAGFLQSLSGGYKNSGYGREQGQLALAEYTQAKSVIVRL